MGWFPNTSFSLASALTDGAGNFMAGACCGGTCVYVDVKFRCPKPPTKPPGARGTWRARPRCMRGLVFCNVLPDFVLSRTEVDAEGNPIPYLILPYRDDPDHVFRMAPRGVCWENGVANYTAVPVNMRPVVFRAEGPTGDEALSSKCVDLNPAYLPRCEDDFELTCDESPDVMSTRSYRVSKKDLIQTWDALADQMQKKGIPFDIVGEPISVVFVISLYMWVIKHPNGQIWNTPAGFGIRAHAIVDADRNTTGYQYFCEDPLYQYQMPTTCGVCGP